MNIFLVNLKLDQRISCKKSKIASSLVRTLSGVFIKVGNYIKPRLAALPISSLIFGLVYRVRLGSHRHDLPQLSDAEKLALNDLEAKGIHQSDLATLAMPGTAAMVAKARLLLAQYQSGHAANSSRLTVPQKVASQDPDISLWGLNENLLNIVENYIGLPIYYLGAEIKREFADGQSSGVRKWHIDPEDHRMVKIIVYLSHVDEQSGPFEYMTKDLTRRAVSRTRYVSGLISDDKIVKVMRQADCQVCLGNEGTIAIFDGCSIFHRAQIPLKQDRTSITFHYVSKYPIILRTPDSLQRLPWMEEKLTDRQRRCLM